MHADFHQIALKYSQNEIRNKSLLEALVNQSSISPSDLVYDIGAGSGTISLALLKKGAKVIAIEKDRVAYQKCREQCARYARFELYIDDFLQYKFPPNSKYKVFSNIPFFHTADIIHKLLDNPNPPEDCYLIVQKEAGEKYAGIPVDTLSSLLLKPVYWFDIIHYFKSEDFFPTPAVDIVLLQIEKRKCRLIPIRFYNEYKDFIIFLRRDTNRTIKQQTKHLFTYPQQKRLFNLLRINENTSPTNLSFHQYLGLFQFLIRHSRPSLGFVLGAESNLRRSQNSLFKIHRTRVTKRT